LDKRRNRLEFAARNYNRKKSTDKTELVLPDRIAHHAIVARLKSFDDLVGTRS
jgi:hypothetical protein